MMFKKESVVRNFSYTLIGNFVALGISSLITFIAPKCLNITDYGYFQLYLFYNSYIGFFHFGWMDGIFLRYGGEFYKNLDKKVFSGQFWLYSLFECVVCGLIVVLPIFGGVEAGKAVVISAIGIAAIFYLPQALLKYVLQATNRIKEYTAIVIIERLVYLSMVILVLIWNPKSFVPLIIADIVGKIVALGYACFKCKDILFTKPEPLRNAINEAYVNISVGIKLMFANIASMLIIGFVRLSIENQWDVATFGKVSLTMSVSNLLMVFIRAVALVMFPMLRRTNSDKLSGIYNTMRTCLMIPLLGMLIFYYPAKVILSAWLPQYADSLVYMALLFPMCVFESKMSMLIETYMKTLRKEKWLLLVNVTTVSLSVVITLITTYWLHNLDLAVASIVFLLAFRCVFAELLLSTVLDVNVKTDIVLELALTIIFIGASWFVGGIAGLAIYAVAYLVYLFIKRNDVAFVLNTALRMVRRA